MGRRVQLDVFELSDLTEDRVELGQSELEECKLTAYEQGYTAGWDDAVAAQDAEITRLRSDLGNNLQDLSFTYHEAHSHVLRSLEPLLLDMVAKVLPATARHALAPMILEELRPIARKLADAPVEVIANAENRALLERMLIDEAPFPLTFTEEPSLSDGQVFLNFGRNELRVDLDGAIAAIKAAIAGFFEVEKDNNQQKEKAVG